MSVASIPSGILGKTHGVCGPYKFRVRKDGTIQFFPRYPRDKRSPAQLEARKKFSIVARLSSACYLTTLKPFWRKPSKGYNAFARSIQRSLPGLDYWHGVPRFYLGGEWELPALSYAVYYEGSIQRHTVKLDAYSNPWLKEGDRIFVGILDENLFFRFTADPLIVPQELCLIGWGSTWPTTAWYYITAFVARDVDGLYDILSQPVALMFGLWFVEKPALVAVE